MLQVFIKKQGDCSKPASVNMFDTSAPLSDQTSAPLSDQTSTTLVQNVPKCYEQTVLNLGS